MIRWDGGGISATNCSCSKYNDAIDAESCPRFSRKFALADLTAPACNSLCDSVEPTEVLSLRCGTLCIFADLIAAVARKTRFL